MNAGGYLALFIAGAIAARLPYPWDCAAVVGVVVLMHPYVQALVGNLLRAIPKR